MTEQQKQVKDWMQAFGQDAPEKPTIPSLEVRKLRAKLILEEALETVRALGFDALEADPDLTIIELEDWTCQGLVEIADGCEDLKVVTDGTLVACGLIAKHELVSVSDDQNDWIEERPIKYDPLFNEVMRSNNSKMWTLPEYKSHNRLIGYSVTNMTSMNEDEMCNTDRCFLVKDKDGKVIKSPSYSPANLQPIIDEMSSK